MSVGTARGTDVPAAEFRAAMGHFATGVTVVTSVDAGGAPVGTTANAVTSLSSTRRSSWSASTSAASRWRPSGSAARSR